MSKLCKETGFLTEDGSKLTNGFKKSLDNLLSTKDVNDMSVEEIRTFGCNLMSMVADRISNKMLNVQKKKLMFDEMSDKEFDSYLKNKYGKYYMFVSLTDEEFSRILQNKTIT
jgi:hypothetical protein